MGTTEKTQMVNNVYVTKDDLNGIGNTQFKDAETGFLTIICSIETAHIEKILLRSILKCFGEEYEITGEEDYFVEDVYGNEVCNIEFKTNLPIYW